MSSGDRLVAAGAVVASLGGAFGVSFFIYSLESAETFWSWPGWASALTTGVGIAILVVGLFQREDSLIGQVQKGGTASTNLQAGRDLTIGRTDDPDR